MRTRIGFWGGLRNMIVRAPEELNGFGAFGGEPQGMGGGTGGQQNDDQTQQSQLIGQENGEEEDPLKDVFAAFADDPDDDNDQNQHQQSSEIPQEQITAMQTSVQQAIQNMRVPDDLIPDDFNGNDPQALRGLMNRVMQHTISNSLNVVFQPVQLAMRQMAQTMEARIESRVSESQTGMKDSQIIEAAVPEINMPEYAGLVKQMDTALKAKGKSAKDRAPLLRKMLNQMGIQNNTANSRRTANPNAQNTPTIRTGHAALDSFFGPLATQPPKPK